MADLRNLTSARFLRLGSHLGFEKFWKTAFKHSFGTEGNFGERTFFEFLIFIFFTSPYCATASFSIEIADICRPGAHKAGVGPGLLQWAPFEGKICNASSCIFARSTCDMCV